ncbi:MAG: TolC family protein [Synechococcus sp. SB0669_bin_8]|nr:TolC family protein [Synechococcus sp. SB0675_bin_6]MYJ60489.1 TolC family protein [Synechococcus sp. SB0672_bin_6]MYK92093.1 TolC family protein [Synechococcus sp. SB0669_bin_8]
MATQAQGDSGGRGMCPMVSPQVVIRDLVGRFGTPGSILPTAGRPPARTARVTALIRSHGFEDRLTQRACRIKCGVETLQGPIGQQPCRCWCRLQPRWMPSRDSLLHSPGTVSINWRLPSLGLMPFPVLCHVFQRSGQWTPRFLVGALLASAQPLAGVAAEPLPASLADLAPPPPLAGPQLPDHMADQQLRPLSLEEAQQLAEVNHPALQAAALEVESREARLEASLSAWKPQATLKSSAGLPALALEYQYSPETSYPRGELETNLNLEATWLWRDPQRDARIAAERHELDQVKLQRQFLHRDLKLQATESYVELQRADAEVDLRLAAVQAAQSNLKISGARHGAGVAARLDVLQAHAQLTEDEALLASAKAQQTITRRRLARVLNLPQGVVPTARDANRRQGRWTATLEESLAAAFASREELQQFLAAIQEREERAKEALAALQPTLSFFVMGAWSQASGNVLSGASTIESQFRGRISTALGLRFAMPLSDGGTAQASARRWSLAAQRQEHLFAEARNAFQQQVERAFHTVHAQGDTLELRARQVATQQEILNLATARYEVGVGTQQDLIDQQNALTRAAVAHAQAVLDYNLSLAQLHRYTGLSVQP